MIERIWEHHSARGEHPLSRVEKVEARRKTRFDRLDTDDDGILSLEEIDTLVSRINEHHHLALDAGAFAAELDKDGNGQVGFDEFSDLRKIIDSHRGLRTAWKTVEKESALPVEEEAAAVSESEPISSEGFEATALNAPSQETDASDDQTTQA